MVHYSRLNFSLFWSHIYCCNDLLCLLTAKTCAIDWKELITFYSTIQKNRQSSSSVSFKRQNSIFPFLFSLTKKVTKRFHFRRSQMWVHYSGETPPSSFTGFRFVKQNICHQISSGLFSVSLLIFSFLFLNITSMLASRRGQQQLASVIFGQPTRIKDLEMKENFPEKFHSFWSIKKLYICKSTAKIRFLLNFHFLSCCRWVIIHF